MISKFCVFMCTFFTSMGVIYVHIKCCLPVSQQYLIFGSLLTCKIGATLAEVIHVDIRIRKYVQIHFRCFKMFDFVNV